MNVLDLFSGIGGFSLGLERAGMRTIAFCEADPFCRNVLARHWPDVPIHEDIRDLRGSDVGSVDLICGGYPCQPFSVAGKRGGETDDRHLWPEMFRLVQELRPAWVIGENVTGHTNMGLDGVLSDLASQNYACRAFVIPACAVFAPHRRDRLWIVAHADRAGRKEQRRFLAMGAQHAATECSGAHVAHAESLAQWSGLCPDETGRERRERSGYGGRPSGYGAAARSKPGLGGMADGIPRWLDGPEGGLIWAREPADVPRSCHPERGRPARLRALGNAVVPQIVTVIGRAILCAERGAR